MSTIKIETPTADEIKQHPREFTLLTQVPGYESGAVALEDLNKFSKKYGSGSQTLSEESSFKDIASAFSKKSNKVGDGKVAAWAAKDKSGSLSPYSFDRRELADEDIRIQITYSGICHTDVHQVKSEWGDSLYPMVPGHEIIGVVVDMGEGVKGWKLGDRAGVGCFVDTCRSCTQCKSDEGQFCQKCVLTYNAKIWRHNDEVTQGGYSTNLVVAHQYALKIPKNLDMASSAPLLCAGITAYSPLKHYGLDKPGTKVGVVGLGGLGHMAVKLAKAMGCEVTVISTSEKKKDTAHKMGADHFVVSKNKEEMEAHANTLDGIIDTVSADHPIDSEISLLKIDGTLVFVGVPPKPLQFPTFSLISGRKRLAGSMIGGIGETQEMLDFCGKNDITCEVEVIDIDYVNTAYERLVKNDVHYRFSIDIQNSLVS